LLPLRHLQADALAQKENLEEAREVFDQVAASEPTFQSFSPEGFWRIKGARDLTKREQAVLRELYVWRNQEAHRRDCPPFKVLNDHTLVALAQVQPCAPEELIRVDGLKHYHVRRYGRRILRAVKRGGHARIPQPPRPSPRHSDAEVARFQALRTWRKQVAFDRGVDTDVIISNAILWALAEQNPQTLDDLSRIEGLGPWKRKMYGQAILKVLHTEY
ncbi:MAG: HRDC domain-containing protein, partial [Chloroflexota bacterium]|nr:HRDC domain-containing protein [Chloroflexota bacterium]